MLQRIREVERDRVFDQFASREGEMITGAVNRVEPRAIILDVGNNVEAILATSEQSTVEHYRIGQNVKAFVLEVRRSTRGPQILVSRTHKGFLKRLFELEVPEIHSGTVEIRAIAREAGSRSKVAVASRQDGLDPVGATVGQRGARVQAVVAELGGEKIDVIPWNDDPACLRGERPQPGPGDLRRHRRGAPDRERHGSRADALAGDRPRGPERPAGRAADRLADRHPERRLGRRGKGRRRRGGQDARYRHGRRIGRRRGGGCRARCARCGGGLARRRDTQRCEAGREAPCQESRDDDGRSVCRCRRIPTGRRGAGQEAARHEGRGAGARPVDADAAAPVAATAATATKVAKKAATSKATTTAATKKPPTTKKAAEADDEEGAS